MLLTSWLFRYDATIEAHTPIGYFVSYDNWGNNEEVHIVLIFFFLIKSSKCPPILFWRIKTLNIWGNIGNCMHTLAKHSRKFLAKSTKMLKLPWYSHHKWKREGSARVFIEEKKWPTTFGFYDIFSFFLWYFCLNKWNDLLNSAYWLRRPFVDKWKKCINQNDNSCDVLWYDS